MTTPGHPAPAASVFAAETPPAVIPLPPVAPAEPRPSPWPGRLDAALAGLVLAFAFLAASSVARNSDLWQHLAAGRLLAQGQYQFGADPFAYTTAAAYWANHSWLFDLGLYGVYNLPAGGAILVVLKALAVVALAWLLLTIRRDTAPWLPAVCAALALLAMSPRLLLQPACVSYLFLGVALWLLWHAHTAAPRRSLYLALLPLLCAVWVNVDGWFLLGPALVALFWLGEVVEAAPRNVPGWLAPLALAACLFNPYGYRAFTLPAELSPWLAGTGLADDVRFRALFGSPWRSGGYFRQAADFHLAAWAYFALVGLGLASFALNRRGLRDWRGLTFAAFGLMAAWQVRTVPFFAVVAGPITALNFQDVLARRPTRAARRRGTVAGRLALVAAGLGLLFVAWTGWPQASAGEGRRVGWAVQADPSLRRVAETLADWRARGMLPQNGLGFAFHPAVADYCAWFAPTEKGFLDHRFALFPPAVLRDYEDVCRGLSPAPGAADDERGDWRRVLRERGVRYLVLYDPDLRRLAGPLRKLTAGGADWALLRIDGRALVFAWRDGGANDGGRSDMLWFDPERLAFGPQEAGAGPALPAAPGEGPGRPPRPFDSWARFLRPPAPPAWESAAAAMYQRQFEDGARDLRPAQSAGLVGLPAGGAGALFRLGSALAVPGALEALPPALPLLAVRAARRAVAANPEDGDAWLVLGQAYLALGWSTGEGGPDGRRPLLGLLRHTQAATALENALRRNPDLLPAHQALAGLYFERNCIDAALDHSKAARALVRKLGPAPGEGGEAFARRLDALEKGGEQLEQAVQDRQNQYVVRTQGIGASNPMGLAQVAVGLGLARKALDDVLLRSQDVLFGAAGARLELELLLVLGRADEVRDKLGEPGWNENKDKLGAYEVVTAGPGGAPVRYLLPAYDWLRACQAAATGDYDLADDCLGLAGLQLAAERQARLVPVLRAVPRVLQRVLATEAGLAARGHLLGALPVSFFGNVVAGALTRPDVFRLQQADLGVVAGLLALERGLPDAAAGHFRSAVGLAPDFGGRPLALAYLGRLRRAGAAGQ